MVRAEAERLGVTLSWFQTNHEGAFVEAVQGLRGKAAGALINAAAFTHTSLAIRDAVLAVQVPFVEVHLSNIFARDPERRHSRLADLAVGIVAGFGPAGLPPRSERPGCPAPWLIRAARVRPRFARCWTRRGASSSWCSRCRNIRYLTGFTGSAGLLLVRRDDIVLVTDFRYASQAPREVGGSARVEIDQVSVWDRLKRVLGERSAGSAGLEGHIATVRDRERLAGLVPGLGWTPTGELVERLRAAKDPGEIEAIRQAAALAAEALAETLPADPGGRDGIRHRRPAGGRAAAARERVAPVPDHRGIRAALGPAARPDERPGAGSGRVAAA